MLPYRYMISCRCVVDGLWSMDEEHDYKVRLETTFGRVKKQVKTYS
jgi:hypothetical protein